MNFRQIEAFRAVMITGSGTEAAKMLFITQPAISRLISDLEYKSGLKLFTRKPNRLEPTPEAHALYATVDRAFIGLNEICLTADAIASQQHGSLRIVAMPVCVDSFLPPLISNFLRQHPNVSINLESAPRHQALEMVRSQQFDFGVISLTDRDHIDLDIQPLCQQQAVCVLPVGHPLSKKDCIHAKDLEDEPFISLSTGSPFRAALDEMFTREGVKRKFVIETRTQSTIFQLVKQGAGVSILDPFVTDRKNSSVIVRNFSPEVTWNYAVVEPPAKKPSLVTKSFKNRLKDHFSEQ
ncbi:MAG: LysR family transcriptional regulator [Sneathiella sp.]|nr:LysR family transcriptional regulator [Sneathiella sp.]